MYCRFCGAEISNQSRFCSSCGKSQDLTKRPVENIWPTVLCYIIGVFFLIGGVLPYLLQGDLAEHKAYMSSLYTKYSSPIEISAISCFTQFSSFLSPLFYFSSSVLAIYIGLLILKKESKPTAPAIACAIVHIVSIIYSGVINLLIYGAPKFVLSLYTSEASIITAGEDIINFEPDMLYYYQDNAICRLIVSVILIALVVVFLFIKKRYMNTTTNDNTNASSIGNVIMILSISVLSVVSTVLSTSLVGYYYGIYAVAANSVAKQVFNLNLSSVVVFAFVIIIGIAVFFTRIKRWILAIPTISIVAILGLVASLFSNVLLRDMETPAEMLAMALINFRGLIISSAVILIAMFYWFSSVSRNKIPMWLQIVLPLSLPIIYVVIEVITNTILHLNLGISCGLVGIALITVIVSLLVNSDTNSLKLD